jgi:UDP-N-acetylmuramyl pentapeptide phosphotransferase/UDP-N-acetylglucosamine-1-phosphate transferase
LGRRAFRGGWSLLLTVFWFMGMMNTINFLDGASGLVAGVTAVLSAVLALHMIFKAEPPQLSVALLPLALLGVALGFLPFNFGRRIFMGSSGSYFLGFVIAALGIIGGARLATVMMVVGLPALEVGWLMFTRWRRGVSPGQGGRDHLHFRLLDMGVNERTLVVGYWLFLRRAGRLHAAHRRSRAQAGGVGRWGRPRDCDLRVGEPAICQIDVLNPIGFWSFSFLHLFISP